MAFQGASSSSVSPSPHWWTYDVFLNFRGEDTRKGFTAHLHDALCRKNIKTYIDDKLPRGEKISPALLKAIESSRISIVILSKDYASSTWCLDELVKILECEKRIMKHQKILPVFYDVSPTEVRHQKEGFGEALAKLKDRLKDEMKVQRWKEALKEVTTLSGFTLDDRNEPEIIQEIVREVLKSTNVKYLNVDKHLVGMQSRVQDIHKKLRSVGMNDTTRILGIFGIGGVGKTTLAKEIYNSFLDQFEYSYFLANVRETSLREDGLIQLQETLLYKILGDRSLKIQNEDEGMHLIKQMLGNKKVLLALDDVDELLQVKKLLRDRDWLGDWLGLGSLIIVTTRNERLLTNYNVHLQYKMEELDHNEARRLFCWNAFKKEEPNQGFAELTENFLQYAGGLPLALEVLGSYLYKREEIKFWEDALEKYKRIPPDNIQDKLRISYDGLEESEKSIFLDIACFFAGNCEEYVTDILNGCGFFPHNGIPILREKSLITINEYGTINMHDLLKAMGKEIVRKQSDKDPGKRTRLWSHEDVRYVLEQNKGTNKIEAMLIDLPNEDFIHLSPGAFKKMPNLRMLIIRNAPFLELPNYFSNELRVLDLFNYHGTSLPSNFNGKNLVYLRMTRCNLISLENKFKNFQNLKCLDLKKCDFLERISGISGLPNLERLTISQCNGLVEISGISGLPNLKELDILSCVRLVEVDQSIGYHSNLKSFPSSRNLRSLKSLNVAHVSLVSFPGIELELRCSTLIQWIRSSTSIKELPHSIVNVTELQHFDLSSLRLIGSTKGISYSKLDSLTFTNWFSKVKTLYLNQETFVILPGWMDRFVGLRELKLINCEKLKKIEKLPPNIEVVEAHYCSSLESFPDISKRFEFNTSNLSKLHSIDLSGSSKMVVNVGSHVAAILRPQEEGFGKSSGLLFPGNKIPNWFSNCKETSNSCSSDIFIEVELLNPSEIKGILTCAVLNEAISSSIKVNYDGKYLGTIFNRFFFYDSDHVWLAFYDLEPFNLAKGSLQIRFECNEEYGILFKHCGVHLVRKDEKNAKRKRDDDCNFKSNWYPQQKSYYSDYSDSKNDDDEECYSHSEDDDDEEYYSMDDNLEEYYSMDDNLEDGDKD